MNGARLPGLVAIGLQSNVKLTIKKAGWIGPVIGTAELRADHGDLRVLVQDVANLGSKFGGVLERDGVRHGGADPERAFVEMREKFSSNQRDEEEAGNKDRRAGRERELGMSETPIEALRVKVTDPVEDAVALFLDTVLEGVPSHYWNNGKGKNERADEREGHGVRHGMEEFS